MLDASFVWPHQRHCNLSVQSKCEGLQLTGTSSCSRLYLSRTGSDDLPSVPAAKLVLWPEGDQPSPIA